MASNANIAYEAALKVDRGEAVFPSSVASVAKGFGVQYDEIMLQGDLPPQVSPEPRKPTGKIVFRFECDPDVLESSPLLRQLVTALSMAFGKKDDLEQDGEIELGSAKLTLAIDEADIQQFADNLAGLQQRLLRVADDAIETHRPDDGSPYNARAKTPKLIGWISILSSAAVLNSDDVVVAEERYSEPLYDSKGKSK